MVSSYVWYGLGRRCPEVGTTQQQSCRAIKKSRAIKSQENLYSLTNTKMSINQKSFVQHYEETYTSFNYLFLISDMPPKLIPQHAKFTKKAKELDIQEKVIKRCYDVVEYLYKVLGEVYGPEELLDLQETLEVIKERGPLEQLRDWQSSS